MSQEALIESLLARYFPAGGWKIEVGASGWNNTTRFIECGGQRYVLRIYETHRDEEKVNFEHAILLALSTMSLAFGTPQPVRARDGDTVVRTEDGKLAALFRYLEGFTPSLESSAQLRSFGRAAGQLSSVIAQVRVERKPVYRPYYEIENIHPLCTPEKIVHFCMTPTEEFIKYKAALRRIGEQFVAFQAQIPMLQRLPHQLVHGDLNASNMLINTDGEVSAILDFEFVTWDLRVMELAVCISDLIVPDQDERQLWANIDSFLGGYRSAFQVYGG
jgi:homoserine kinase type II